MLKDLSKSPGMDLFLGIDILPHEPLSLQMQEPIDRSNAAAQSNQLELRSLRELALPRSGSWVNPSC